MATLIDSLVKGDVVTLVYDHPHRAEPQLRSGIVEKVAPTYLTIKDYSCDQQCRSFTRGLIVDIAHIK